MLLPLSGAELGGWPVARPRAPARFGLVFPRTFHGGIGRFAPGAAVRGAAASGASPCLWIRADRVCIYDGFQLCVGLGFPVRRRGVFCAGGLRGVACGSSSVLFRLLFFLFPVCLVSKNFWILVL